MLITVEYKVPKSINFYTKGHVIPEKCLVNILATETPVCAHVINIAVSMHFSGITPSTLRLKVVQIKSRLWEHHY